MGVLMADSPRFLSGSLPVFPASISGHGGSPNGIQDGITGKSVVIPVEDPVEKGM